MTGRARAGVEDPSVAAELFMSLLGRTHLSAPADVAELVALTAAEAGGDDAVLFLADHEQENLVPVPRGPAWPDAVPVPVDGSVRGRAYVTSRIVETPTDDGRRRLALPLLDGTERLGVLVVVLHGRDGAVPEPVLAVWERFAHLVAQVVQGKSAYGDTFERVRRTRPMAVSAELQRSMAPPLTFATQGLVVSAILEPCYDCGGDTFDYAVDREALHLAVVDAMGHGLTAARTAAVAVAAYRRARRGGLDPAQTYASVDAELADALDGEGFATAVLGRLDLASGVFTWVAAGHPEPLLLRDGRLVKTLAAPPATPLGTGLTASVETGSEQLQPGDRLLLHTDGLAEARTADGTFFGLERLGDFVERASHAGYAAPETLRRLRRAVLEHQDGRLQDDATAVLVEWRAGGEERLMPQTVDLRDPR